MFLQILNGEVIAELSQLPETFGRFTALTAASVDVQREAGFYDATDTTPAFNSATHAKDIIQYTIGDPTYSYSVRALTAGEIDAMHNVKIAQIKALRDFLKFNGVFVSGKWIHSDPDSRTQWLGLMMMGANVPPTMWTTRDGTEIQLSQALATGVFTAIATLDMTVFAIAKNHIAAMITSADPANYDYSAGWPATYIPA